MNITKSITIFVESIIMILLISSCSISGVIFRDMDHLPDGDFLKSVDSPNGNYTINAYVFLGNATVANAVRCSVTNNETKKERNIYWQDRVEDADITWINNFTVIINEVELNVEKDTYDFRDHMNENVSDII